MGGRGRGEARRRRRERGKETDCVSVVRSSTGGGREGSLLAVLEEEEKGEREGKGRLLANAGYRKRKDKHTCQEQCNEPFAISTERERGREKEAEAHTHVNSYVCVGGGSVGTYEIGGELISL